MQQAPGFVAGYWTNDQAAGKAYAMILLDSEEAAHQLKAMVEGNAKKLDSAICDENTTPPSGLTVHVEGRGASDAAPR